MPGTRRNSQRGQIPGTGDRGGGMPLGTTCSGGRMWWTMGSETPRPLRGRSSRSPRTSSLLALLSLTSLLYFTVTYSVCISFIGSQKLFSVSASELSPLAGPIPARGGRGVLVRAFPASCSHRRRVIPRRQRTSGISSSGQAPSTPHATEAQEPAEPCPSPPAFTLLSHRVIFPAVE